MRLLTGQPLEMPPPLGPVPILPPRGRRAMEPAGTHLTGSSGRHHDGEHPPQGNDLVIRSALNVDGSISIAYEMSGAGSLESTIAHKSAQRVISFISHELSRVRARFGADSVATVERLARWFSEIFLPPEVVTLARSGRIGRLCVLTEGCAPCLPWELAHDGTDYLALNLPVLHATSWGQTTSHHPKKNEILILEGVPDQYGLAPGYFLPDSGLSIRSSDFLVARVRVRNSAEFADVIEQSSCGLLVLNFHSIIGPDGTPRVIIDKPIDISRLIESMAAAGPHVIVLNACETASVIHDISYDRSAAFLTSSRLQDGFVLGVIGWLDMATAQQFVHSFTHYYLCTSSVEQAVLEVRRKLFKDRHKDWWCYSLYGPAGHSIPPLSVPFKAAGRSPQLD